MVMSVLRSKKFARRVLLAILILIIPAFVLWGVGSMGNRPQPVGKIDGKKIFPEDIAESMQGIKVQLLMTLYGNSDMLRNIMKNRALLERMAWERLVLLDAAKKARIKVTDKDVLEVISTHPVFQRDGSFNKEAYDYILRNTLAIQPRLFEEIVRQNLQVMAFRNELLKGVTVTDDEVKRFFKSVNDKAAITYLLVDKELFAGDVKLMPGEAKVYYDNNKNKMLSPAKIDIEYIAIPYGSAREKGEAVEKLKKIYPDFRTSPRQFASLAEKNGLACGRTGPFFREQLIPGVEFSKEMHAAAFALKKDEISLPLIPSSDEGVIYILHKTDEFPSEVLSFEEVRDKLSDALLDMKKLALSRKKADEIIEEVSSGNKTLEGAASEIDLEVVSTGPLASNDYIENIGPARGIIPLALTAGPGTTVSPIPTKKGALIVRTDQIFPADEAKLIESREDLRKVLLQQKQIAELEKWFREKVSM